MHNLRNKKLERAVLIGIIILIVIGIVIVTKPKIVGNVVGENSKNSDNPLFMWKAAIITVGSLIFIWLVISSLISSIKISKEVERLKDYILECKNRGYARTEILNLLNNNGWSKDEVDEYF